MAKNCVEMTVTINTEEMISEFNDTFEIIRQWFDAVQDLNAGYLEHKDYELAEKIYKGLGMRVPNSIKDNVKFTI